MAHSYIFDIETDGLLPSMTKIHCIHVMRVGSDEVVRFDKEDVPKAVELLSNADALVGHNIIAFDLPAIAKVFKDFKFSGTVYDTLVYCQVLFSTVSDDDYRKHIASGLPRRLTGSQSLEAWGYRFGMLKGDYAKERAAEAEKLGVDVIEHTWGVWNQAMSDYCEQDVRVSAKLFSHIIEHNTAQDDVAIQAEQRVHEVFAQMQRDGFPVHLDRLRALISAVSTTVNSLHEKLVNHFGTWYTAAKKKEAWPAFDEDNKLDFDIFLDGMRKPPVGADHAAMLRATTSAGVSVPVIRERSFWKYKSRALLFWQDRTIPEKQIILNAFRKHGFIAADTKCQVDKYEAHNPEHGEDGSRRWWGAVYVSKRTVNYKKLFKLDKDGNRVYFFNTTEGAKSCKLKRVTFNPASRPQIVNRLTTLYDWQPTEFTDKGTPQVTVDTLDSIDIDDAVGMDMIKSIADYLFHAKLLGQISTGRQAWIKHVDDKGIAHCRTNAGGTVTGRCSHSNFNIGQVPSLETGFVENGVARTKKGPLEPHEYRQLPDGTVAVLGKRGRFGAECRDCFIPHEGHVMLGADLKNIEVRCLADVCSTFDDGELIDIVLNNDVHSVNLERTGVRSKAIVKRCLFGLLYGAGDWKLGHTAEPTAPDASKRQIGADIRAKLLRSVPGLAPAIAAVRAEAERGYIIGLDGRRIRIRSMYGALNTKLQGQAAAVAKLWAVKVFDNMRELGCPMGIEQGYWTMLAHIHDEIQCSVAPDIADVLADVLSKSAVEAGSELGMRCPVAADVKRGMSWLETH